MIQINAVALWHQCLEGVCSRPDLMTVRGQKFLSERWQCVAHRRALAKERSQFIRVNLVAALAAAGAAQRDLSPG